MFYRDMDRQCPSGFTQYTVIAGETLYTISRKFNTSVEALITANPGINPMNIYGGLRICVPQQQPQGPVCPIGTSPYTIKSGDTYAIIARTFGTTVQALISANPGVDPNRLRVGQQICVTQNPPQNVNCPTLNTYVVRTGDTMYKIAYAFGITVQQLQASNPGVRPTNLYDGMVLCLPLAPVPYSIVVNIQAKRLDLYRQGNLVKTYPVATGKPTTPTPVGTFTIVNKQVDPGGPFGTRWMGLSEPHYGIHGTNNPASIGTAASNGCIRMYNRDVEDLFNIVSVGTVVRIF